VCVCHAFVLSDGDI